MGNGIRAAVMCAPLAAIALTTSATAALAQAPVVQAVSPANAATVVSEGRWLDYSFDVTGYDPDARWRVAFSASPEVGPDGMLSEDVTTKAAWSTTGIDTQQSVRGPGAPGVVYWQPYVGCGWRPVCTPGPVFAVTITPRVPKQRLGLRSNGPGSYEMPIKRTSVPIFAARCRVAPCTVTVTARAIVDGRAVEGLVRKTLTETNEIFDHYRFVVAYERYQFARKRLRAAVRRHGRVTLRLRAVLSDPAGNTKTKTRKLRLVRKPPPTPPSPPTLQDRVERRVERIVESRVFDNIYAVCDPISPRAWSCRITSVTRGSTIGYVKARFYGSRLFVGPVRPRP